MDLKRVKRILLFKPAKLLFNIFVVVGMPTSKLKKKFSDGLEDVKRIGYLDKDNKVHFLEGKDFYCTIFDDDDLYKGGKHELIKKNKIGVATDGKVPMIFKKFKALNYYEFKAEISCLLKLSEIESVPNILYIDFKRFIIYMSFVKGVAIHRNYAVRNLDYIGRKRLNKRVLKIINTIHERGLIISDLDARNILYHDEACHFIDFGDSINCEYLPSIYFDRLREVEINHYEERVKTRYLSLGNSK